MKVSAKLLLANAGIATAALLASRFVFRGYGKFANDGSSRSVRRYPQMIVDHGAIAQWNRNVTTRQVLRHQERHA